MSERELGPAAAHYQAAADALPDPDATRRPGIPAHPIRLSDGRPWGFAQPTLRVRPVFSSAAGDGAGVGITSYVGYPLRIERLKEQLSRSIRPDDDSFAFAPLFALALALLIDAHDISPGEAAELLTLDLADLNRVGSEILEVTLGYHLPPLEGAGQDGAAEGPGLPGDGPAGPGPGETAGGPADAPTAAVGAGEGGADATR